MNVQIRVAVASDYEGIQQLVKEVHQLHVQNRPDVYLDSEQPFGEQRYLDILEKEHTQILVIDDMASQELIGYTMLQIVDSPNLHIVKQQKIALIDDFCIAQRHRGKGMGKMLLNAVMQTVQREQVDSLQLTVWEFNEPARAFYESAGMQTRNRRMEINFT